MNFPPFFLVEKTMPIYRVIQLWLEFVSTLKCMICFSFSLKKIMMKIYSPWLIMKKMNIFPDQPLSQKFGKLNSSFSTFYIFINKIETKSNNLSEFDDIAQSKFLIWIYIFFSINNLIKVFKHNVKYTASPVGCDREIQLHITLCCC